jgi:hypothetical protein
MEWGESGCICNSVTVQVHVCEREANPEREWVMR